MNNHLIHIGLGKTSTSSLQNHVFPKLSDMRPDIFLTDQKFRNIVQKHHLFGLSEEEKIYVKKVLERDSLLSSVESLVGWDPSRWEEYADRNLSLFGRHSHILITVRDTESYLSSVYRQIRLQQGNICKPNDFFVDEATYSGIARQTTDFRLEHFNVDAFDLQKLARLYEMRFENVSVVPITVLNKLIVLRRVFSLTEDEIETLQKSYSQSPHSNASYSSLAVRLTLFREKIASTFGFRSIGSDDRSLIWMKQSLGFNSCSDKNLKNYKQPSNRISIERIKNSIEFRLKWRSVMQYNVDKFLPYHPYKLPTNIYRNTELIKKNAAFIEQLEHFWHENSN